MTFFKSLYQLLGVFFICFNQTWSLLEDLGPGMAVPGVAAGTVTHAKALAVIFLPLLNEEV